MAEAIAHGLAVPRGEPVFELGVRAAPLGMGCLLDRPRHRHAQFPPEQRSDPAGEVLMSFVFVIESVPVDAAYPLSEGTREALHHPDTRALVERQLRPNSTRQSASGEFNRRSRRH